MASTDALPVPLKNTAYRVTFPILDSAGDLVAGATGLDSEVSKDGGAFADCTNEAQHIGQGVYYLDLTSTEMNADTVAVLVKSTEGKTVPITIYPAVAGDVPVDFSTVLTAIGDLPTNSELATALAAADDAVLSAIGALNDLSPTDVETIVEDALSATARPEPAAVPAANAALVEKLDWVFALLRNKILQTASAQTLRNDADDADIATAAISDDGTTTTRAEWV